MAHSLLRVRPREKTKISISSGMCVFFSVVSNSVVSKSVVSKSVVSKGAGLPTRANCIGQTASGKLTWMESQGKLVTPSLVALYAQKN